MVEQARERARRLTESASELESDEVTVSSRETAQAWRIFWGI